MPEEIDVACPGCNAIFGVPVDFCGQTAECAECGSMFEIPELKEKKLDDTSTGAIKGVEADSGEATNTVRLSRTGIGMIPQIKDDYQLGTVPKNARPAPGKAPAGRKPPARPSAPSAPKPPAPKGINKPPAAAAPPSPSEAPTQTSMGSAPTVQDIPPRQPLAPPPWTNIRIKKNEDVTGVREVISSPAETAFLVVIPLIIAGAAGLLSPMIGTPVAAGIVGATCIITFVVALIMNKNNAKKALIVTNQRSIAVIGKTRIEIKK